MFRFRPQHICKLTDAAIFLSTGSHFMSTANCTLKEQNRAVHHKQFTFTNVVLDRTIVNDKLFEISSFVPCKQQENKIL